MPKRSNTAIGIDVGGTFMKAALVTSAGDVLAKESVSTEADGGPDHMIARMAELVRRMKAVARAKSERPKAVGLGMPGTLSHREGIVYAPPNLPGWKNVPVAKLLSDAVGLSVILDNDANCAALGEYVRGAGRGTRHMVLLTLGTGIGGGMILEGKVWRGADASAGEWGHTIVHIEGRQCSCGQNGCLEAYASASSTAMRAAELIVAGEESVLKQILDRGEQLTAEDVVAAAERGDDVARRVWQETCKYLAVACRNIQHAIDPERIILAGGMSAAGRHLLDGVTESIAQFGSKMIVRAPDIRLAELGNDAGFIGAALCACGRAD